jgi:hypothetical protein
MIESDWRTAERVLRENDGKAVPSSEFEDKILPPTVASQVCFYLVVAFVCCGIFYILEYII